MEQNKNTFEAASPEALQDASAAIQDAVTHAAEDGDLADVLLVEEGTILRGSVPEKATRVLGISPGEEVTMAYAPEHFTEDSKERVALAPSQASLVVTTAYPNGGFLTRSYDISIDTLADQPSVHGNFLEMSEMEDDEIAPGTGPRIEFDETDVALQAMLKEGRGEPEGRGIRPEEERQLKDTANKGRDLSADEAEAIQRIAQYFIGSAALPNH